MEQGLEILAILVVAIGAIWFVLAQASGIRQGNRESRGSRRNLGRPKHRPF